MRAATRRESTPLRPAGTLRTGWLTTAIRRRTGAKQDAYSSRHFLTGYALAASGRYLGDSTLALVGEDMISQASNGSTRRVLSGARRLRREFPAEALVYLLRYYDHGRRPTCNAVEPALRRALAGWSRACHRAA